MRVDAIDSEAPYAMKRFDSIQRLFTRLRYPVSLPEEVAEALGIELPNTLSFSELVARLSHLSSPPTTLHRFMLREKAEESFVKAPKVERFCTTTLFSYYFYEGWLEFILRFDDEGRLRRLYLQHKSLPADDGVEIALFSTAEEGHQRR